MNRRRFLEQLAGVSLLALLGGLLSRPEAAAKVTRIKIYRHGGISPHSTRLNNAVYTGPPFPAMPGLGEADYFTGRSSPTKGWEFFYPDGTRMG